MSELRYLKTHEWFKEKNGLVTVGISIYAQGELGDIVFVILPDVDKEFTEGEPVAELEATKTVAEVYAPFDCKITEVNPSLDAHPELINSDPLGEGWLLKATIKNYYEKGMTEVEYLKFIDS